MARPKANDQLLDMVKSHTDSYLQAYRTGYEAGWQAALTQAMKIIERKSEPMKGPTP